MVPVMSAAALDTPTSVTFTKFSSDSFKESGNLN